MQQKSALKITYRGDSFSVPLLIYFWSNDSHKGLRTSWDCQRAWVAVTQGWVLSICGLCLWWKETQERSLPGTWSKRSSSNPSHLASSHYHCSLFCRWRQNKPERERKWKGEETKVALDSLWHFSYNSAVSLKKSVLENMCWKSCVEYKQDYLGNTVDFLQLLK